jgi:hypothetical protein
MGFFYKDDIDNEIAKLWEVEGINFILRMRPNLAGI